MSVPGAIARHRGLLRLLSSSMYSTEPFARLGFGRRASSRPRRLAITPLPARERIHPEFARCPWFRGQDRALNGLGQVRIAGAGGKRQSTPGGWPLREAKCAAFAHISAYLPPHRARVIAGKGGARSRAIGAQVS